VFGKPFQKRKGAILKCFALIAYFSGLAWVFRQLHGGKVPILAYHSITSSRHAKPSCLDLAGMTVTRLEFRKQMEYLATHYNTITLEELVEWHSGNKELPPNPCIITFDDGYVDVYENAIPILEELGLKATLFVIGRSLTSPEGPWLHKMYSILDSVSPSLCAAAFEKADPDFSCNGEPDKAQLRNWTIGYLEKKDQATRLKFLEAVRAELSPEFKYTNFQFINLEQLEDIRARGFEIGCHSTNHEVLARMTDRELTEDILECKKTISSVTNSWTCFCYPFGHRAAWDERVIQTLKEQGFVSACTTEDGLNSRDVDLFHLYRIGMYSNDNMPLFVCGMVGLTALARRLYKPFT